LKEINNFVLWISKAREVLADQGENYYLVEKFEEKGVASLIENLGNIEDFYETDVIKLLVENRKTIGELLKIISNPATKIKARSFDMNYIKKLIDESQQIKFPEDEENLVKNSFKHFITD